MAKNNGILASVGVADSLQFENDTFDIIIFGFCLYLCDREDLFAIASEADRVLKKESWLIIQDFYCNGHRSQDYIHKKGIKSFKMDYRTLFDWHPSYTCYSHLVAKHGDHTFTDDANEWVATSILKKYSTENGQ